MIDRNIFIGLAAGIVAGVVGYKIYEQNKESIDSRLKNLGICPQDQCKDTGSCQESSACNSITLEELEAQKERLEDLIAEQKAQMEAAAASAQSEAK